MPEYTVEIRTETTVRERFIVEAEDEQDALSKAGTREPFSRREVTAMNSTVTVVDGGGNE